MAWLDPAVDQGIQQVNFVTIDPSTFAIASEPTELVTPNRLSADLLSVSQDNYGNAVISWMDMDIEQSVYYALIRYDGNVLTTPIEVYNAQGKIITVSKVRASNAAYIGKSRMFMPSILD